MPNCDTTDAVKSFIYSQESEIVFKFVLLHEMIWCHLTFCYDYGYWCSVFWQETLWFFGKAWASCTINFIFLIVYNVYCLQSLLSVTTFKVLTLWLKIQTLRCLCHAWEHCFLGIVSEKSFSWSHIVLNALRSSKWDPFKDVFNFGNMGNWHTLYWRVHYYENSFL